MSETLEEQMSVALKALRNERDLTQEQVAKIIGVKRAAYGEYERGKNLMPLDRAIVLSDNYGVSLDTLTGHRIRAQVVKVTEKDARRAAALRARKRARRRKQMGLPAKLKIDT